jgi:sulfate transport system ATP-binding protein
MVTHDQEEALDLSDRLVVMDKGKIHQVGSPAEVYETPATSFVASFVGSANVLYGQVRGGRAHIAATSLALATAACDGAQVRAVVRPHDIRIERLSTSGEPVARSPRANGRIQRIVDLGTHVKLALGLTTQDQVTVHVSRQEFETMALKEGETVLVDLENARVFVEDYVI